MNQTRAHVVVMTTVASEVEARTLAERLVEARLAACVQIMPIRSIYTWEGRVHDDQEHLLLVKTRGEKLEALETLVREAHSYEVPEITVVPIEAGSAAYLGWIDAVVAERSAGA